MVLVTRVVASSTELKEVNLTLELNGLREFFPHLQSSHQDKMDGELMISPNMLTLGPTREAIALYKVLFRTILTKRSVRDLDIEMTGVLP